MSQTPRTDNFKSQGREWLPLGIFEKVERENTILRDALEKFRGQFDCYECSGTAEDTLDSLANVQGDGSPDEKSNAAK